MQAGQGRGGREAAGDAMLALPRGAPPHPRSSRVTRWPPLYGCAPCCRTAEPSETPCKRARISHQLARPARLPLAAGLNQPDLLEGINHLATARFMHVIAPHPETGAAGWAGPAADGARMHAGQCRIGARHACLRAMRSALLSTPFLPARRRRCCAWEAHVTHCPFPNTLFPIAFPLACRQEGGGAAPGHGRAA